ncbi:hypothetical protein AJ80_05299 [Polytolypa hystricis UAMH7299]|uniref:Uncharacterized protein n=1 Tax=Polytolypa hystricis (strain UAMH7299) TaxID=1447883 RepID=A0A2B7XWD1_POLH7|nr:hypothetical protein AJ80_05299 [Polytolypa hystricis UAMH7299]
MADDQSISPEIRHDVDLMVLDYLMHRAIKGILSERIAQRNDEPSPYDVESLLGLFITYFENFMANHPNEPVPSSLEVKLQIFNVANLLCRRYKPSPYLPSPETVQAEQEQNTQRARKWLQEHSNSATLLSECAASFEPITKSVLTKNYHDFLVYAGVPRDNETFEPMPVVSLQHVLPEYINLCNIIDSDFKEQFIKEAIAFMLQSAIEQILVYNRTSLNVVDEAFAWDPITTMREEANDTHMHKTKFDNWNASTEALKENLRPNPIIEWAVQLQQVLTRFPFLEFEGRVLSLLSNTLQSGKQPILTQLESGSLCGLTVAQTREFMDRVGIRPRF